MIVPVVFPSAGEFWLKNNPEFFINYTFNDRRLCSLPEHYEFAVSSQAARTLDLIDLVKFGYDLNALVFKKFSEKASGQGQCA